MYVIWIKTARVPGGIGCYNSLERSCNACRHWCVYKHPFGHLDVRACSRSVFQEENADDSRGFAIMWQLLPMLYAILFLNEYPPVIRRGNGQSPIDSN